MKAAIYARKSRFTGKGESIENQVKMCKEYAALQLKDKNITDFIIYNKDEGFTGGNTNRPDFQKMVLDIKVKKFDILICYRLDRISRNVADFSNTLELLQKNNISFVSIKEQFDTSTPMGKAMVYISSVFAQLERDTIAERVRDNMLQLSKTGRWLGGQTPLGFKSEKIIYLDAEYKERSMYKLSPITNELNRVKLIFHKYLELGSLSLVLKYLLSNNIKGKNGGEYASMSINDILRNPVYVKSDKDVFKYLNDKGMQLCGNPNGNGILIYNKRNSKYKYKNVSEWIAAVGKHKGIISSSSWLEVQKRLDKNSQKSSIRQGTSRKSLLSGVLKCGICGAPMRISYNRPGKDGNRVYYYTCTMKCNSRKTRCNNPNVRGDYLEKAVIDNISKLNREKVIKELKILKKDNSIKSKNDFTKDIKNEIENKKIEMNILLDNLSKAKNTAYDLMMSKVNNIGEEIKNLQLKLDNAKSNKLQAEKDKININILLNNIRNFNTFFNSIKKLKKDDNIILRERMLLETIIDKITWNGITKEINIDLWGAPQKINHYTPKKVEIPQYTKSCTCMALQCK